MQSGILYACTVEPICASGQEAVGAGAHPQHQNVLSCSENSLRAALEWWPICCNLVNSRN